MDYLDSLNDAQREAVVNTAGPAMVIAGAGSGKTRVLTYRIAHLIRNGVDPFRIMSLTFTNKAAREMQERIAKIVGPSEARNIWMGTFHSIFARILRFEHEKIGYPSNFTIYDTADSKSLLKSIMKELGLDDKVYKAGLVYGRISSAKNNLISPPAYSNHPELMSDDQLSGKPRLHEVYAAYAKRCFKAGAMDFDDLLYKTNVLFRDHPDVLHKYQHRFNYLLVDEYQDTNYSQYLIVKKLAAVHENLAVVGDDAQSIYAFRGANIQNILNFKTDYPDYKLYKLEQNYRSTKTIVEAANSVIAKNKEQIQKNVWTANDQGDKIKVVNTVTDGEEGKMVARSIFELKNNEHLDNKSFAILYRTNAQSRSLEEALRKIDIPYRIFGGLSFYQRKEIKDVLAYYRLVVNPKDEEALKRVINYPARGIGKTTMEKLVIGADKNQSSIWEVMQKVDNLGLSLNGPTRQRIGDFVTMIQSFQAMHDEKSAFALGKHITASSGILKDLYADKTPEGISRHENVEELLNGLKDFSDRIEEDGRTHTLAEFLQDVALLTDQDLEDDNDRDKVALMTIHMAKGLEFPHVFIVGLEENLFPSQLSINSRAELEEERRLFYVALTRAEKTATLSYADTRYRWGQLISCEPSRFIEEVDVDLLELPTRKTMSPGMGGRGQSFGSYHVRKSSNATSAGDPTVKRYGAEPKKPLTKGIGKLPANYRKMTANSTPPSAPANTGSDPSSIKIGMQVEHARFGQGKVVHLEAGKATVFFPKIGQKQLLLRFAKLTIVE